MSRSSKFPKPWRSQRRLHGGRELGPGAGWGLELRFYSCCHSQAMEYLRLANRVRGRPEGSQGDAFALTVGPVVSCTEGSSSNRKILSETPENITFLCWDRNNSLPVVLHSFGSCCLDDLIHTPWARCWRHRDEKTQDPISFCFLWTSKCRALGFLIEPVPESSRWSVFHGQDCSTGGEGVQPWVLWPC